MSIETGGRSKKVEIGPDLDFSALANQWLRQPPFGILHANDGHYGIFPALREIGSNGAKVFKTRVVPHELIFPGDRKVLVSRYLYDLQLPGIIPIEVPWSVYFVDEVRRCYCTGEDEQMLNALDWVNDHLGFPGVLTTMSAAGIPFPAKDTESHGILREFNNGGGFKTYSNPREWRRPSEYPPDEGTGETSLLGAIFDKQSPQKWRGFYERMCTAHRIIPNLDNSYWMDEGQTICAEGPRVTMVFASAAESGIFYRKINLQNYNQVTNLRNGRNGEVSGVPITMWVTPDKVDVRPPLTWITNIPQSFT